jgi:hypothetical protein
VLLHHLEERGLHLRGRAVDLVREEEVAEDGALLGVERPGVGAEDPRADEVAGHEIRRELDALERAAQRGGCGLDRQRLGEAGYALDQQVAAGEQAHEHPLQHPVLPGDHAPDLEERALDGLLRGPAVGQLERRRRVVHVSVLLRVDSGHEGNRTCSRAD